MSNYMFILLALVLLAGNVFAENGIREQVVFRSGEGEYHTYRIPALIVSRKGTLLAFCEGRRNSRSDTGEINTLLRRSFDNGETWGAVQVVAADGSNTFGNPCPVVERVTGTIWLLLTKNLGEDNEADIKMGTAKGTRTVWVSKSTDDGATWSTPVEITSTTKAGNWSWYATGPGVGIQTRKGRLVIPCDYSILGPRNYGSHTIYSDDRGRTWELGGTVHPDVNECQVVELEDGSLMLNMRSYQGENRRVVAVSKDGGLTWSEPWTDPTLIEPVCQASFIRYTTRRLHDRSRLLFSNPASAKREKMTVRLSYDEGKSWPVEKLLYAGPSAYSCLSVLRDKSIACLYERGVEHPYETITFAQFSLDWLTDGKDRLAAKGDVPMRKTDEFHIRDPFILPVEKEKAYYIYGTRRAMPDAHGGASFETFVSKDLENWEGPFTVFQANPDFWGTRDFWAPEVHEYKGKYYLFGTFSADRVLRATQILVSDSPRGPFEPLTDRPITPFGQQCLDGTLFVDDDGKPWIVYCHEWEQIGDGTICAMPLTEDLKYSAGKPVVLFQASEAPWISPVPWNHGEGEKKNYITDGPCLYRASNGHLLMLWASFGKTGYVQGVARSESGKITGPWTQEADLLYPDDGGHGMIFRTFDGRMLFTLHSPNSGGRERARMFPIEEKDGKLRLVR